MSTTVATSARGRSAIVLLFAGILWGTGGLSGSVLASEAGLRPLSVAAYRLLIGGACAIVILAVTGGLRKMVWIKPAVRRMVAPGTRQRLRGGLRGLLLGTSPRAPGGHRAGHAAGTADRGGGVRGRAR
jgi:hypothetical protein